MSIAPNYPRLQSALWISCCQRMAAMYYWWYGTNLNAGTALAALWPGASGLVLVAQIASIGQPHRWLNPAAVADVDGEGRIEILVVVTPQLAVF